MQPENEQKEEWTAIIGRRHQNAADTHRNELSENKDEIEEKQNDIEKLLKRNHELYLLIRGYERNTDVQLEKKAGQLADDIYQMAPTVFKKVELTADRLLARTYPVEIEYDEWKYNLGSYDISIWFIGNSIEISSLNGIKHQGYPHPHVDTDDHPCLGNIHNIVHKLLINGDYSNLLNLLNQFVRSYNDDNPFVKIERWDPDYEEDDKDYQGCYENSSSSDCIYCDDEACPYWASRFDNCYELADRDRCVRCGAECPYHDEAVRECREDNGAQYCIEECDFDDCPYKNADTCHAFSAGEECRGCPVTDCKHFINKEEDDDGNTSDGEEDTDRPHVSGETAALGANGGG